MKRQSLVLPLFDPVSTFKRTALIVILMLGQSSIANAQDEPLNEYVAEGLRNNLALQQRTLDLQKSLQAMEEARGMFFPEVSLQARYSRAAGGRQIEFPVGDLLNPVYSTLNDILASQGQPAGFPQLENVDIAFLRDREQETKVRITQPLFQPAVLHNYRLQRHLSMSDEAAVEAYRQALTRDIKVAYYNYLKADRAVEIYDAARGLVDENLRVNERLFDHDKVTRDAVFRARAEMLAVSQDQSEAQKDRDLAQSYFNFLLNRPFDEEIVPPDEGALLAGMVGRSASLLPASVETPAPDQTEALTQRALENRYELKQLEEALQASRSAVEISKSSFLPGVSLALDLGMQGTDYGFAGDRSYYMASVVLDWKLFRGGQNRSRLQQAKLDTQKLRTRQDELQRQIALQVQEAYDNLNVAYESLRTAQERRLSAREGYRLVSRKYDEGMSSQVAFLDARTTLTEAELNLNITYYDVLIRMAELDYAASP